MKTRRFGLADGSNAVMRLSGKFAVITVVVTGCVLLPQANAFASSNSNDLSSVILPNSLPGLVELPLGTYNGPITQLTVDSVMGSSSDATSALGQSLANGDVTAYIRSWGHQPSNGDAVIIGAFEFTNASEEHSVLDGLDFQMLGQSGSEPLAVPGISGATGSVTHTAESGTAVTEYEVTFAKGNTVFQVAAASASGDITGADGLALAQQQFANAPDIPAATSGTGWQWRTLPPVGLVLAIAIFVIGRKRKYPEALRGLPLRSDPTWNPPPGGPPGPWGAYPSPTGATATEQVPKVSAGQWQ
jgi:hypothetical protein